MPLASRSIASINTYEPLPWLTYSEALELAQIMRDQLPGTFDAARFKPAMTSHHADLPKTMALDGRGLASGGDGYCKPGFVNKALSLAGCWGVAGVLASCHEARVDAAAMGRAQR